MNKYFPQSYKNGLFVNLVNCKNSIFKNLGSDYIKYIRKFSLSSKHITDKLPLNFRWIGLIKLVFPNAKVIHCVRNAKDNCLSAYKNYFIKSGNGYAYDLKELAQFYNLYSDLMNYWHSVIPNFVYNICYEKLIKKQKN